MHLSIEEKKRLEYLIEGYLRNSEVRKMDSFIQHGTVSTLDHCQNVTRVSYWLNSRLHLGCDEKALVTGAMLHDFYLYDWHGKSLKNAHHGFTHPILACENAVKYFHVNKKEQDIIRCHMWPLTLTHVPSCREAVVVCAADKYCSLMETLTQRKNSRPICD